MLCEMDATNTQARASDTSKAVYQELGHHFFLYRATTTEVY